MSPAEARQNPSAEKISLRTQKAWSGQGRHAASAADQKVVGRQTQGRAKSGEEGSAEATLGLLDRVLSRRLRTLAGRRRWHEDHR